MKQESRKIQRFAVQLPCKFGSNKDTLNGIVLNLSAQGCAMLAEQPPSLSSYVSLEIDLLNGEAPACIELAGVRWISGQRCGLEFIRVSPEMLTRLQAVALLLEKAS